MPYLVKKYCADRDSSVLSETAVPGQFSLSFEDEDSHYLVRDSLGSNKLFYHLDPEKKCLSAGNFLIDVSRTTGDYNNVRSVPAGHCLRVRKETLYKELLSYCDLSRGSLREFKLDAFRDGVNRKLTRGFEWIRERYRDCRFVVCLSGGLDSSIIASYASRYLEDVTAASFSYTELSEDFLAARSIARLLELPFLPIIAERRLDQDVLDDVLIYGQDWRDFNVHCAWVNHIIGTELKKSFPRTDKTILLTGDLMNELVADYVPVEFGGVQYYSLPKIPKGRLRKFLVYGLDSGDREIGVFSHHGFTSIQPYSFVVEDYLSVPDSLLEKEHCKETLNLPLLTDQRLHKLVQRNKLRAQVGGKDGGTLGLFHEYEINQTVLCQRWTELFSRYCRETTLNPIIAAGRYVS